MSSLPRRYRLYIDESGDHTYKDVDDPRKRYLGLLGCIVNDHNYISTFSPSIDKLKTDHFPAGSATVFHRTEIMNCRGPFHVLRDENVKARFDRDLLSLIGSLRYGLISVVIDKKNHLKKYPRTAFPPYHYCMKLMLERYCYFLNRFKCVGDVMAEVRGKAEDRMLQEAFSAVYAGGTEQHEAKFFQATLTSKEIKFRMKSHNVNGLQFADILANPLRHAVLEEFGKAPYADGPFSQLIRKAVVEKYNRNFENGKVTGYGLVLK